LEGKTVNRKNRPIPDDFRDLALTMPRYKLALHYVVAQRTIQVWFEKLGIEGKWQNIAAEQTRRPIPADFAQVAPTKTRTALCKHYRCSDRVAMRWSVESGVACMPYTPTPPRKAPAAPRQRPALVPGAKPRQIAQTNKTMFDLAADVLRRERFHVHRCNERGGFDLKGQYWRCGYSILTDDELLIRAAKYEQRAA
jgi:hypothetical protein